MCDIDTIDASTFSATKNGHLASQVRHLPVSLPGHMSVGGRGGIRTHGTLAGTPVFKTGALNHSATLPLAKSHERRRGRLQAINIAFARLRAIDAPLAKSNQSFT